MLGDPCETPQLFNIKTTNKHEENSSVRDRNDLFVFIESACLHSMLFSGPCHYKIERINVLLGPKQIDRSRAEFIL